MALMILPDGLLGGAILSVPAHLLAFAKAYMVAAGIVLFIAQPSLSSHPADQRQFVEGAGRIELLRNRSKLSVGSTRTGHHLDREVFYSEFSTPLLHSVLAEAGTGGQPLLNEIDSSNKPSIARSVLDYGAVGDGHTDDTAAIEKALNESCGRAPVSFPAGKVFIASDVDVPSGCRIEGHGATLKLESDRPKMTAVIDLGASSDIKITGLLIDGNKYQQKLSNTDANGHTKGKENGGLHGIRSYGATGITLNEMVISNNFTDGFYLGPRDDGMPSRNILLRRVVFDGNRRQGISIIHAENVFIDDSDFKNTKGQPPEAGIDIEPNHSNQTVKHVRIQQSRFINNSGAGVVTDSHGGELIDLIIERSEIRSRSNRSIELKGRSGAVLRNISLMGNKLEGRITIGGSGKHETVHIDNSIEGNHIMGDIVFRTISLNSSIFLRNNCLHKVQSGKYKNIVTREDYENCPIAHK